MWLTARRLHEGLAGCELVRGDLRVPRLATVELAGRRVREVSSRGKHLLIRFEGDVTLHSHLRMEGAWRVYPSGQRWTGGPSHQIRAVLETTHRIAVGYRLPVLDLLRTSKEDTVVGMLGPDLLGADWDPREAVRRLLAAPDVEVAEALLDQCKLAGIGNVYKAELCFLRGISPWTPISAVPEPLRLVTLAHELLDANKARSGHVTTGDTRPGRTHWVYDRARQPCRRCGTAIRVAEQGAPGRARLTYWCPACQRGPAPK